MAISNYESIVAPAEVRWRTELELGRAEGLEENDFMKFVYEIEPERVFQEPGSNVMKAVFTQPHSYLKEDNGQVQFRRLPAFQRTIAMAHYNDAIEEDLNRLHQPATLQMHADAANVMGENISISQYKNALTWLLRGDTAEFGFADDGQFMFDTDHKGGDVNGAPTAYSNVFDLALSETNLGTVLTAMMKYRSEAGIPWGNKWKSSTASMPMESRYERMAMPTFHLVVGPALAATAADIADLNSTASKKYAGTFTWSNESELDGAYANYWFVMFLSKRNRKPLNFINGGNRLIAKTDVESEPGRLQNRAEWIVRADWGFSYGDWHVMAMSRGV